MAGEGFNTLWGQQMRSVAEIFRSYAVLDAEGRHIGGTDKQSNHSYSAAYESLFLNRAAVSLVMEIGVADGSSLLAWAQVFPNAGVVGLDIHPVAPHCLTRFRNGMEFHLGDQRSLEDCRRAAAGRQFDFICEDATHLLEDSLRTLLYLWPHVRPGGLYVIEEFANVGALRENITALWPNVEIVDTKGPFGGIEPLVVLRKPVWNVEYPKAVGYKPL